MRAYLERLAPLLYRVDRVHLCCADPGALAFLAGLCASLHRAGAAWLDLNPGFLPPARRADTWQWLIHTAEAASPARKPRA